MSQFIAQNGSIFTHRIDHCYSLCVKRVFVASNFLLTNVLKQHTLESQLDKGGTKKAWGTKIRGN